MAFSLLGLILTHNRLNMSNEMLHHLARPQIRLTRNRNVRRNSKNRLTYELILLC